MLVLSVGWECRIGFAAGSRDTLHRLHFADAVEATYKIYEHRCGHTG